MLHASTPPVGDCFVTPRPTGGCDPRHRRGDRTVGIQSTPCQRGPLKVGLVRAAGPNSCAFGVVEDQNSGQFEGFSQTFWSQYVPNELRSVPRAPPGKVPEERPCTVGLLTTPQMFQLIGMTQHSLA